MTHNLLPGEGNSLPGYTSVYWRGNSMDVYECCILVCVLRTPGSGGWEDVPSSNTGSNHANVLFWALFGAPFGTHPQCRSPSWRLAHWRCCLNFQMAPCPYVLWSCRFIPATTFQSNKIASSERKWRRPLNWKLPILGSILFACSLLKNTPLSAIWGGDKSVGNAHRMPQTGDQPDQNIWASYWSLEAAGARSGRANQAQYLSPSETFGSLNCRNFFPEQ